MIFSPNRSHFGGPCAVPRRRHRFNIAGYFIPGILAIAGLPHAGGAGGIGYARRAAAVVHHGIEAIALFLEARHQRSLERAAARQLDAHRIDETPVDQNLIMDVGAGRHAGRAHEADHLALPHPLAGLHALGVGRHVAVGGLVAVVVLQADVFAVTAFPAGLFDDAVAGGKNRCTVGRGPIDAGMHLDVAEDGMAAAAEARAHDRVVDRLADQELLRALAGLVVIVDHGVVGGLETVVFLGLAADREGGEQHLALFGIGGAFVFAGKEHVEGVAGLHLALEIDVVGVDANHVFDDSWRHLVAQRGLIDALIKPHPGPVVIIVVAIVGGLGDGVHAL